MPIHQDTKMLAGPRYMTIVGKATGFGLGPVLLQWTEALTSSQEASSLAEVLDPCS